MKIPASLGIIEDSNFDSASMMSVVTSGVSTCMERQTQVMFDRCINCKVVLPKLDDDSSMNDQWIWWLMSEGT